MVVFGLLKSNLKINRTICYSSAIGQFIKHGSCHTVKYNNLNLYRRLLFVNNVSLYSKKATFQPKPSIDNSVSAETQNIRKKPNFLAIAATPLTNKSSKPAIDKKRTKHIYVSNVIADHDLAVKLDKAHSLLKSCHNVLFHFSAKSSQDKVQYVENELKVDGKTEVVSKKDGTVVINVSTNYSKTRSNKS